MTNFRDYNRRQPMLLPPDLREWVQDNDLVHFICEAVERVPLSAFHVSRTGAGKAQYHPYMMLALLIYCYSRGLFSSRKIEAATYRDVSVRYIAANLHPDHDTIATFRVKNAAAIQEAFKTVLLLANETGLLKVGSIALDGTKLDANASKIKSIRYDRIQQLRKKLDKDIAELMEKAKTADQNPQDDGLSVPDDLARRQKLKDKLDAAAKRLEEAEKQHAAPKGRESDDDDHTPSPKAHQQTNLTDPDSAIMRKSNRHEYRQAYNAQAAVCADGSMLVLATDVLSTSNDRAGLDTILEQLGEGFLKPKKLLADSGYAGEQLITSINNKGIDPFIAPNRQQAERPYDFRPPPDKSKTQRAVTTKWRIEMNDKLKSEEGRREYKKRKQSVEPVFGIIKRVLGFTQFQMRGLDKVKNEWSLVTLAYNVKRMAKLSIAG